MTVHIAVRRTQAGSPATVATMVGPPASGDRSAEQRDQRRRPSPARRGARSRGSRPATRPRAVRTSAARPAASPPGRRARRRVTRRASAGPGRPPGARSDAVQALAQARIPPVASVESWKPGVADEAPDRRRAGGTPPSRARPSPGRPGPSRGRAGRRPPSPPPGRPTAMRPRKRRTRRSRPTSTTARRRRPSRPTSAATVAATIAMFQPEIATTWLAPDRREGSGEVAIDAVAQADDDPGRQPGLRFGDRGRESIARGASKPLELRRRTLVASDQGQASGEQRPIDPDPREVRRRTGPPAAAPTLPDTPTRSPGAIAGNRGSVDATRTGARDRPRPVAASSPTRRSVATCWPSRGAEIATTSAVQGPEPSGSPGVRTCGGVDARRSPMTSAPIATSADRHGTDSAVTAP